MSKESDIRRIISKCKVLNRLGQERTGVSGNLMYDETMLRDPVADLAYIEDAVDGWLEHLGADPAQIG